VHVALPCFDDGPPAGLERRALAAVALPVQLELPRPEVSVGLRQVWEAARAVMPIASVDKDCKFATRVGDIGPTWCFLPVEAIATETSLT
jgi:hypothetical protein